MSAILGALQLIKWWPGADKIAGSDFGPRAQRGGPLGEAQGRASSSERPKAAVLPREMAR